MKRAVVFTGVALAMLLTVGAVRFLYLDPTCGVKLNHLERAWIDYEASRALIRIRGQETPKRVVRLNVESYAELVSAGELVEIVIPSVNAAYRPEFDHFITSNDVQDYRSGLSNAGGQWPTNALTVLKQYAPGLQDISARGSGAR